MVVTIARIIAVFQYLVIIYEIMSDFLKFMMLSWSIRCGDDFCLGGRKHR